jgi:glutaminyl-peptide cyclotransferase
MNLQLIVYILVGFIAISSCTKEATNDQQQKTQDKKPIVVSVPSFDGAYALATIEKQVSFGPRVPNTASHVKCKDYLIAELSLYADTVIVQSFEDDIEGEKVQLFNIIAKFKGENPSKLLLLGAHWDSRPLADEDPNPKNAAKSFDAANDGGSGVGVLLSMAKSFKSQKPPISVDIVLFDGEDLGLHGSSEYFCRGSKYYTQQLTPLNRPTNVIILDLVGDKEAQFTIEGNSYRSAPSMIRSLWSVGAEVGNGTFVNQTKYEIYDDHIPFIEIGIPSLDIIDAELVGNNADNPRRRYWHTADDTMDNIAESSLSGVGKTVLTFIYQHYPNL